MTTESPATQRDFVELHTDVSHSPLWNRDLAPTTIKERTWSTWNIAALWIGMSVVITTYTLAGGFIEAGMSWQQAMITILLGNTIVLIPMILNAHAGTKYGISFPVLCRASFGTKGANVPAILRAIVACGWFGIQTWIGGQAMDALFGVMNDLVLVGLGLFVQLALEKQLRHAAPDRLEHATRELRAVVEDATEEARQNPGLLRFGLVRRGSAFAILARRGLHGLELRHDLSRDRVELRAGRLLL